MREYNYTGERASRGDRFPLGPQVRGGRVPQNILNQSKVAWLARKPDSVHDAAAPTRH